MVFQTWQFVVFALAGWLNRQQQDIVAYLSEENRVLREQLKGKRLRFTDDQRRRLAAKGQPLGRKLLGEICTLVTPETLLCSVITESGKPVEQSQGVKSVRSEKDVAIYEIGAGAYDFKVTGLPNSANPLIVHLPGCRCYRLMTELIVPNSVHRKYVMSFN